MRIPTKFLEPNTPNRLKYDRRYEVILRDGAKCRHCGHNKSEHLSIDHIIPRSLGGKDYVENLQILCLRCHRKKTKQDIKNLKEKGINLNEE